MSTQDQSGFESKVAFITGAGGGIGRGTAIAFAGSGAHVVVTDISKRPISKQRI